MESTSILQGLILLICCSAALACHGQLLYSGITADERRIILAEHNRLRATVATGHVPGQPGAENMREMVWDEELAQRAQAWANNCQFKHDPRRTISRFTQGQNLAIIWSTIPLEEDDGDFPSRIQSWFNEVQKYSFGSAWSPKTGHYSQLVWGETNLVGCGFSYYKDSTKYNKLYVCNYGPGGNVVGVNPYEVGRPSCRNHGLKPSPRYQGLCQSGSAGSSGVFSNTIDTYDYKQKDNIISKTSYSTHLFHQQPQQAIRKVSVSSLQRSTKNVPQTKSGNTLEISNFAFPLFKSLLSTTTLSNENVVAVTAAAEAQAQLNSQIQAQQEAQAQLNKQIQAQQEAQAQLNKQIQSQLQAQLQAQAQAEAVATSYAPPPSSTTTTTTTTTSTIEPFSTTIPTSERTPEIIIPQQTGWSILTWRG